MNRLSWGDSYGYKSTFAQHNGSVCAVLWPVLVTSVPEVRISAALNA